MSNQAQLIAPSTRLQYHRKIFDTNSLATAGAVIGKAIPTEAGPDSRIKVAQGNVGAELAFYGTDGDNETGVFEIWLVDLFGPDIGKEGTMSIPTRAWTGTFTLASGVPGLANGHVIDTEFFADTITLDARNDFATYIEAIGKAAVIYSPADDANVAKLSMPDFRNPYGIIVDIWRNTAASVNGLLSVQT